MSQSILDLHQICLGFPFQDDQFEVLDHGKIVIFGLKYSQSVKNEMDNLLVLRIWGRCCCQDRHRFHDEVLENKFQHCQLKGEAAGGVTNGLNSPQLVWKSFFVCLPP